MSRRAIKTTKATTSPKRVGARLSAAAAPSSRQTSVELSEAKQRIEFLETENKQLTDRLKSLRKAKAPTTRVVKEATKFDVLRVPSAKTHSQLPPIKGAEPSPKAVEELREARERIKQLEASLRLAELQIEPLQQTIADLKQQHGSYQTVRDEMAEEIDRLKLLLRIQQSEQVDVSAMQDELRKLQEANQNLTTEVDKWRLLAREAQRRAEEQEKESAHAAKAMQMMLVESLRLKMTTELEGLKAGMTEMKHDYDKRLEALRLRWNKREVSFRGLWDAREKMWSDTVDRWKSSAEVVVTRKVTTTRTLSGEAGNSASGDDENRTKVSVSTSSTADLPPDVLAKLGGTLDGWERKPSDNLGSFGDHGL
eukprot:m.188271 g.188271  ORF g.188271 m.188271 type:complete len:367 (-) comp18182_c1_seq1:248-1348(-)